MTGLISPGRQGRGGLLKIVNLTAMLLMSSIPHVIAWSVVCLLNSPTMV
jgi:hypothetical protein